MTEYLASRQQGSVLELCLMRPEKKNALNSEMYEGLIRALREADSDASVRVVLLCGEGDSFTSGNDLADFAASGTLVDGDNPVVCFLEAFRRFSKPVVVAAHGDAVGVGTTLMLHADMVFAAPDTRFSLPFVRLGLCPEYASSYLLPRLAGHVRAFEWLVLGQPFSAVQALDAGLINAVDARPREHGLIVAQALAELPPNAVVKAKQLLRQTIETPVSECMNEEIRAFSAALKGDEFAEAVGAFFEKRRPVFKA